MIGYPLGVCVCKWSGKLRGNWGKGMILTGIYFLNSLDFGVVFMFHILRKKKRKINKDGGKILKLDAIRTDEPCHAIA